MLAVIGRLFVLAAALVLLAGCGRHGKALTKLAVVAPPVADRVNELTERADRGRVRPLQPPAAPDTRSPVAARPAPQRASRPPARPVQAAAPSGDRWALLRQCESGGDYATNTGNGFYGAYQFTLGTWRSVGGTGLPSVAPPAEQDMRAHLLYQRRGAKPWPVCGRYL